MLLICVVLLMILESTNQVIKSVADIPLSKSLGYPLDKKFGNARDTPLYQEYIEQYHDILRLSQESIDSVSDEDTKLRGITGNDFEMGVKRRRSASRYLSPALRRKTRSQQLRREKLNSQGLRSHIQHSKQINQYKNYD